MKNYWGLSKHGVALVLAVGFLLSPCGVRAGEVASDATAGGEPASVPDHGPRMHFETREHDFGEAMSGVKLKTTFTFKNVGDAVLHIQKVSGG